MADSVRDRVRSIQRETLAGNLMPERVRELELILSSLIGNCNAELQAAEAEYNAVLLKHLESAEKANRARIRAETSPEYQRKREAKDTKEVVVELLRSMRSVMRSINEEMRLAR